MVIIFFAEISVVALFRLGIWAVDGNGATKIGDHIHWRLTTIICQINKIQLQYVSISWPVEFWLILSLKQKLPTSQYLNCHLSVSVSDETMRNVHSTPVFSAVIFFIQFSDNHLEVAQTAVVIQRESLIVFPGISCCCFYFYTVIAIYRQLLPRAEVFVLMLLVFCVFTIDDDSSLPVSCHREWAFMACRIQGEQLC